MSLKFHDNASTITGKLERVLSAINKRRKKTSCFFLILQRKSLIEADDEHDETMAASTQFLSTQKDKINELQDQFQHYVNTLLVFGLNSAKFDLNGI